MGDITLYQSFTGRALTEWLPFSLHGEFKVMASVLINFDLKSPALKYKHTLIFFSC